jgi:hypothetical protein
LQSNITNKNEGVNITLQSTKERAGHMVSNFSDFGSRFGQKLKLAHKDHLGTQKSET